VTGVGTAKQPTRQNERRVPLVASISLVALIFLSLVLYAAWFSGGKERMLLLLQPGFTVTAIDREAKTLVLSRVQESFVVNCGQRCDLFEVGKRYSLRQHKGILELTRKGEKIELPILREHFDFETPPGGHG